jgi:hypothetical protein
LKHDRAVCLPHLHFAFHKARLMDVLPKGEIFELVEVGAHARGTVFLDRNHLLTPALTDAFDAISRCFRGFYFGRYDVRAPSVEDFQQGRNIKVLELNGLTSEVAHVYDPHHGVFNAWRDLMHQWKIAFDISDRLRARGHAPLSLGAVFKLLLHNEAPRREGCSDRRCEDAGRTPLMPS